MTNFKLSFIHRGNYPETVELLTGLLDEDRFRVAGWFVPCSDGVEVA